MTRPIKRMAVLAAALSGAACADRTPVLPAATAPSPADAAAIERLVQMGFARKDIVDAGDRFVVEGDMSIPKSRLGVGAPRAQLSVPGGPRGQWKVTNPVQQADMRAGLTVNLSSISGNSAWLAAARLAMGDWELSSGVNTIKFIETSGTATVSVSFGTPPTNGSAIAEGQLAVNGQPGTQIIINTSYANSLSAGQKRWVMVHELGHIIGFRHSDWVAHGESASPYGADSIPNTPSSDLTSVMRATNVSPTPSFTGFNTYDVRAAEYVYPAQIPTLTSVGYDGSGSPSLTWNAVSNATGYRIRFSGLFVEWVDDPSRYEGGYWGTSATNGDITTTSSTSFVDATMPYSGDDWCHWRYQVWTIYASGKIVGPALTDELAVCGPFPS